MRRFHASAGNGIVCEVQKIDEMLLSAKKGPQIDSIIKLNNGDVKLIRSERGGKLLFFITIAV